VRRNLPSADGLPSLPIRDQPVLSQFNDLQRFGAEGIGDSQRSSIGRAQAPEPHGLRGGHA
jgi:hypothetical protein